MSRTINVAEFSESAFLNKEGIFTGKITGIEPGITNKGDEKDTVTIQTEEGQASVILTYPTENDGKYAIKMGFLKRNLRLMGLDVESGDVNVNDTIGNEVTVKSTAREYDATDQMGNPTGEKKTAYNIQLVEAE